MAWMALVCVEELDTRARVQFSKSCQQRVAAAPIERASTALVLGQTAVVRTGLYPGADSTVLYKHEANYRGCLMTSAIDG